MIEAFVASGYMNSLGVSKAKKASSGRKPFHPAVLLKLYLYDYLHGLRSSRKTERAGVHNPEVMWLV